MTQQTPSQRQAASSSVNALLTVAGAHGERLDGLEAAINRAAEVIRTLEGRLKALEAVAPAPDGGDTAAEKLARRMAAPTPDKPAAPNGGNPQ